MGFFVSFMASVYDIFNIPLNVYGFVFSFWDVLVFSMVGGVVFKFIGGVFYENS